MEIKIRQGVASDAAQTTPLILNAAQSLLTSIFGQNKNKTAVVLDIPLLLEGGIHKRRDVLLFVQAKKKDINKKLKKRYNFNPKIIKKLKKLQLPLEIKKRKSDFIIKNNFRSISIKKNVKILKNKILNK